MNICSLDDPGILRKDIDPDLVTDSIEPEVRYSCLYWFRHWQESGYTFDESLELHSFLETHLLHWLEALALLGRMDSAIETMSQLKGSCAGTAGTGSVYGTITAHQQLAQPWYSGNIVMDAERFIKRWSSLIQMAPLQVHMASLVYSPTKSNVRNAYREGVSRLFSQLPTVDEDWGNDISTLEGHSDKVIAVAFSPNGKLLAAASSDMTVRLWDVASGQARSTLKGHTDWVTAVAFSPDGKLVASASGDGTVRLWDVASGHARIIFKGHTDEVVAVTFQPDGKLVASASDHKIIRVWDIDYQSIVHVTRVNGHTYRLTFSGISRLRANFSFYEFDPAQASLVVYPAITSDLLHVSNDWVMWNSRKILWLPSEYRLGRSAVFGNTLVMGNASGKCIFMTFDAAQIKQAGTIWRWKNQVGTKQTR